MTLTLCIHTSAKSPWLYLLRDGVPAGEAHDETRDPTTGPTLGQMATGMLSTAGATISDLTGVLVDIGPGRLSAVRAGVSFANALSFGAGIPVAPVNASAALGMQAHQTTGLPALVVHKSAAGTAYVGRYEDGVLKTLRYGPHSEAFAAAANGLTKAAVVGLSPVDFDTVDGGNDVILVEIYAQILKVGPAFTNEPLQPITELSEIINA